jgi:hypothetical protein
MARRSSGGGGGGIAGLTVSDLRRELIRRERTVGGLVRRRERLIAKVRDIEAQIMEHGGAARGGGLALRKRPKNDMNLVQALSKVLTDKVMSVTDVSQAVQDAGYKTTSPSFRTIVNQTLINSGKFKRVERGKYTAK